MRTVIILSLGILLLCGVIIMAQQQGKKSGSECTPSASQSNSAGEEAAQFNCLPDDITLQDVVTYSIIKPERNETVRDKLSKLKAKCENGKLVDEHRKEIRFFRLECWGNPPADYQERQQQQQDKLKELEKKYTVIVMGCDPHMQ